jgi:predicted extracellular nuclease
LALAATSVVGLPTSAGAASADIVISEVYGGGGGNGSAPYKSDFVELKNNGASTVSVAGWSIQYASASGSTWSNRTALTGSIAPGATYLIQLSTGSTGAALPTPQVTGTTNVSATNGKVALVTNNTNLACGSNCDTAAGVKDFLGHGTANDYETAAAQAGSTTTSLTRNGADTDNNSTNFTAVAPTPGATGGGGASCTGTRIHTIQRASHTGQTGSVSNVPGIVTGKGTAGFFLQELDSCVDTDVATSEGIYVYTSSTPTVNVGDSVKVSGTVSEYRPGGTTTANLTTTEITSPSITRLASGQPLPAATVVGVGGRVPPASVVDDDATGNVETSGTFDATTDGIDFWESMEGMRITIKNSQVVGPTNPVYGETAVVPGGSTTRTPRGGIILTGSDQNPERITVADLLAPSAVANVGDSMGDVTGLVDYNFGSFMLEPTATPTVTSGGIAPESTTPAAAGELSTATFNVENLDPTDPQSKFDGLAAAIVTNLKAPDLVALEEVQDNSGPVDDGVVAADQTMDKLIAAITAAGGPSYSYKQINPTNDTSGGEPGGNIRCVVLYRTDRGLGFVAKGTPTSSTDATLTGTGATTHLVTSPALIKPTNSAWDASRKPLVGEFTWNGQSLFVVANHFNSKGGDDPIMGKYQPQTHSSETQRHSQANLVRGFANSLLAADPNAKLIVLGDINDFEFSQTTSIMSGSGATALTSLVTTLPANERYTYDYQGNSQVLDQLLTSPALTSIASYDVVHINAEFSNQLATTTRRWHGSRSDRCRLSSTNRGGSS